jgi:hypothetical protein
MKVKYILDEYETNSKKGDILKAMSQRLGDKVLVKGDTVEVHTFDEREVADMLNEYKIEYTRS